MYHSHDHCIFFLTSVFIDSIQSIRLQQKTVAYNSMRNGRENRSMATKKKAKKAAKKKH